jgi:hypothetical protein
MTGSLSTYLAPKLCGIELGNLNIGVHVEKSVSSAFSWRTRGVAARVNA